MIPKWTSFAPGLEVGEMKYQAPGWKQERRIVVVREEIRERPEARGRKLIDLPGYTFHTVVTTLALPAADVWRFEDIAPHWDQIMIRAYATIGGERVLYQEGPLAAMRHPDEAPRPLMTLRAGTIAAPAVHDREFRARLRSRRRSRERAGT